MRAIPTLSTIAAEFVQQRCKISYVGLQLDAPTRATVCRKFVDSKIQSVRYVLGILVVKLKDVSVEHRICPHLLHQVNHRCE